MSLILPQKSSMRMMMMMMMMMKKTIKTSRPFLSNRRNNAILPPPLAVANHDHGDHGALLMPVKPVKAKIQPKWLIGV